MDKQNNNKTLLAKGKRITVTAEVYQAYYQLKEREDYLMEVAAEKEIPLTYIGQLSGGYVEFEILDTSALSPEEFLIAVEEAAEKAQLIKTMLECLDLLKGSDRIIIEKLFFDSITETELSKILGITQQAVSKKKKRIVAYLKKVMGI